MSNYLSEIRRSSLHVWQGTQRGYFEQRRAALAPEGCIGLSLCHISSEPLRKAEGNFGKTGKPLSKLIKRNHREHENEIHGEWLDGKRENEKKKVITFWPEGSLIKMGGVPWYEEHEKEGSKRGVISGFSGKAQRRMMEWVSKMRRRELPVFVTLTYPRKWPVEPGTWKVHLDRFLVRVEREYGSVCQLWKLEDQQRGAPHFHLLIWGVKFIPYQWVSLAWADIIHKGSGLRNLVPPRFIPGKYGAWAFRQWINRQPIGNEVRESLCAGARAEAIRSSRGVKSYVNKYMTKRSGELESSWGCVGRFWGIRGRKNAPESVKVEYEVSELTQKKFRRLARRFLNSKGFKCKTFGRLLTDNPITWVRALDLLEGGVCEGVDLTCDCEFPKINEKEQAAWDA